MATNLFREGLEGGWWPSEVAVLYDWNLNWQLIDITNPCALLAIAESVALFLYFIKINFDVHIKTVIVVTDITAQIYKTLNPF